MYHYTLEVSGSVKTMTKANVRKLVAKQLREVARKIEAGVDRLDDELREHHLRIDWDSFNDREKL